MLAYLPTFIFLIVCGGYLTILVWRYWWRLDRWSDRLNITAFSAWIGFFGWFSFWLFGDAWRSAERANQAGAHFWTYVCYLIGVIGTVWLIRQRLYWLPRVRQKRDNFLRFQRTRWFINS
ncbi:MAG: hypothetical protein PHU86_03125 [Patescibacteria group bacterium]|jgi:hypothetical protein|nr:hypothetical protein [Patescibacteria group bacterium]